MEMTEEHQENGGQSKRLLIDLNESPPSDSPVDQQRKTPTEMEDGPKGEEPETIFPWEILPASIIPATWLNIGSWERISMCEGDLEAKFFYSERRLRWEFIEGLMKNRIEIKFSNILAIREIRVGHEPGLLDIELNQPPLFFQTLHKHPRSHPQWQQVKDFTGGQASTCRMHSLKFPPGKLDEHYKLLLQRNKQLQIMNQRPFPSLTSPYFPSEIETNDDNFATPVIGIQTVVYDDEYEFSVGNSGGDNNIFRTPSPLTLRSLRFITLAPEENGGGKVNKNDSQTAVDAAELNGSSGGRNGEFCNPRAAAEASARSFKFTVQPREANVGVKKNKNGNLLPAAEQIEGINLSQSPEMDVVASRNEETTGTQEPVEAAELNGSSGGEGNGEFGNPSAPAEAPARSFKFTIRPREAKGGVKKTVSTKGSGSRGNGEIYTPSPPEKMM